MASIFNDPLFLGLLAVILGFVLFAYLFVRRIVTGFREGVQEGRR